MVLNFRILSYKTTNMGDCLTEVFFEFLSEKKVVCHHYKEGGDYEHFISTGSIIGKSDKNSIVIGSGAAQPETIVSAKKILFVRGPLTRNNAIRCNIDCPEKYGDPFILFPLFYNADISVKYDIGFIPHSLDKKDAQYKSLVNTISKSKNILEININCGKKYKKFINDVLSCNTIISSSLHGVIIGIVYGKKVIYTRFRNVSIYKFEDFFASLKINYKMLKHDQPDLLSNIIEFDVLELKNIGISMINLFPFIDDDRKKELINQWKHHCENNF